MDDVDDVNLEAYDKPALEPANKPTTASPIQLFAEQFTQNEPPVDAVQSLTPLKLEVSASEDEATEQDNHEKNKVVKKLNLHGTNDKISQNNHRVKSLATTTKRSNKIPRRNSSDDYVLGFNEQNGEVELLKKRSKHLPSPSNKQESKLETNSSDEQLSTPTAAKRFKKSTTPTNEKQASPTTDAVIKTTETNIEADNNGLHSDDKSAVEAELAKEHIVGDSEEQNTKVDYGKPFRNGWKRELVWRVNSSGKDKADIYFISPAGKKLRSRNEIQPLLKGDLRIEDFSFAKEPLGISPEHELVRHAKPLARTTQINAVSPTPTTPTMGKRVSKPKVPKGASPPPEGWTPTRAIKMNNNALSSTSSKHSPSSTTTTSVSTNRSSMHSSSSGSQKSKKPRKLSQEMHANSTQSKVKSSSNTTTNNVSHAEGKRKDSLSDSQVAGKEPVAHEKKATTPTTPPVAVEIKYPQTIAVVKGKKYVMVSKAIATSTTDPADSIQSDLKQIKEGIRNIKKSSTHLSTEPLLQATNNSNNLFAANFFSNISSGYSALICILKYLKIHERSRAALVCKIWNLAAKDTSFWQTVRMKNSKVCDWAGFATALRRGETKHLDLRKMLLPSSRSEDMWQNFCEQIGTVATLEIIDMCRCSAHVIESLFQTNKNLRVLNALAINDNNIDLQHIEHLQKLEELRLRPCDYGKLKTGLAPLQSLSNLKHLSLTGIRNLGTQGIDVLAELTSLQSLELGECGQFDSTFASSVLPKLQQLQRLRLENNQSCCTLEILDAVKTLTQLTQLELVNFDIKPGFDLRLCECVNIQKLLIIPTYISQSATTNNIVLSAVQKVSKSLKVFTWGVTVELLRVTALYVDQCEGSTKKEKQHFDECIPVLKPVPGSLTADDNDEDQLKMDEDDNEAGDVPQIEIIPLDKVEMILANNLPQTKFTIVKIPYHATCKQQLVD